MDEQERILREVENDVLDRYHYRFTLLTRYANVAIAAVLRECVNVFRGLRSGAIPKNTEHAKEHTANEGFRGIAHCLRWIRTRCPQLSTVPTPSEAILSTEARDLLRWGATYDPLYNEHTAFSRWISGKRLAEARVDTESRTITFIPPSHVDPLFFVSQVEARRAESQRQAAEYPDAQLCELSKSWFDSAQLIQGRICFDDTRIASSGALQVVLDWLNGNCLPELLDDCWLGGFSAGALRRILAAIHVAALFRVRLEDVSDEHHGPVLSHVLSLRWHDLIEWLYGLSNVPRSEISEIMRTLAFDNEPERVTLAHKPLILGCDHQVFLAPRLILALNPSHMVVGAMNLTSSGKARYDAVSGQIASSVVTSIARRIRTGCLVNARLATEREFRLPDGSSVKPDLVLLSADAQEVFSIDVKNAIPPFGVGYIYDDLIEVEGKWKPQIETYVSAFRNSPGILSQHFQVSADVSPKVYGLIILRWPFPIPVEFGEGLSAIDAPTLLDNLQSGNPSRSLGELHRWIRSRPDVAVVHDLAWKDREIPVDDWTYRFSVLTPT